MIIGMIALQKRQLPYDCDNSTPISRQMKSSLAMVSTRVQGRGEFTRDRAAFASYAYAGDGLPYMRVL